jgi:hypothetical protein
LSLIFSHSQAKKLGAYKLYCTNQAAAIEFLNDLKADSKEFNAFLAVHHSFRCVVVVFCFALFLLPFALFVSLLFLCSSFGRSPAVVSG